MALTDQQKVDMRADLGITPTEPVFSDAELDRLYARADSDYKLAVLLALKQLLMDSAKRYDYAAGQTNVKAGDVFDHLYRMYMLKKAEYEGDNQMRIVGLRPVPTFNKEYPATLPGYGSRYGSRRLWKRW